MHSSEEFPLRLCRFPEGDGPQWELVDEFYGRLLANRNATLPNEVARIDSNTVICRVSLNSAEDARHIKENAPVYRLVPNGPLCVATGLVFVTLKDGFTLEQGCDSLKETGFVIDKQSPAGGAWLRHESGSISAALRCYLELGQLEAIRSVEPQFLVRRSKKKL